MIINNLLPGTHETARIDALLPPEMKEKAKAANPTGRFGQPDEFGAMCAFLCSQYVGYMVGQNILLDGGAYNSTMG